MDSAVTTESYAVEDLTRPVEILVDRWGIPHIYAESMDDLFVAQGFNAARDRLFQLDLWRRRALGRLAEAFGESYVDQDRAARLLLYRGDMESEWASYGEQTRQIVTQFVSGINAYVRWLPAHPSQLPPEFIMLDYRPALWEPEDVVRTRTLAPTFNLLFEMYRARVAQAGGLDADHVRQKLERGHVPAVPDGLDLEIPTDVLRDYLLATQAMQVVAMDGAMDGAREGSNNWALAGSRTTTGRPLLASDPHRAYATPSLRYVAHLSAPGFDVIGAGEPSMPGIALGHNGTAAFGFTIFTIDTEDLYVCDLSTEPLTVVIEDIPVRNSSPRSIQLEYSPNGPVLYTDAARGKAYVLRSTISEPGTAPYLGSLDYLGATSWAEFEAGLKSWRHPGENHVYADVNGTIAWKSAGLVPRRSGYDGLLPVPGDGRYSWDGFLEPSEFPGAVNPDVGFVATANEFSIPDELPATAYEWPDHGRHTRITDVLSSKEKHSLDDMLALQTDQLSLAARAVVSCLRGLTSSDPSTCAALDLIRGWDAVAAESSAAAALYEIWWVRHLGPAYVRWAVPPSAAAFIPVPDPRSLRAALGLDSPPSEHEGPHVGGVLPLAERAAMLLGTLKSAFAEVVGLLGPDPADWRWGDLHQTFQPHPLGHLDPSFDVGPDPIGGSGSTVNAASYWPEDFSPNVGASFRMVVDVGEWDNSVCVNTPGQSGDPRSKHYRDLFETWRKGEYIPMLYSRSAVEAATETRITLEPATSSESKPGGDVSS